MGDSSFCTRHLFYKNRFSFGIHVHLPCTQSRLIYFKHVYEKTNMESNQIRYNTLKQKFSLFGFQAAKYYHYGVIITLMTDHFSRPP